MIEQAAQAVKVMDVDAKDDLTSLMARFAAGDDSQQNSFFRVLSETIVYTPIVTLVDIDDGKGTKRVSVKTITKDGKKVIPTFTSDEGFFAWVDEDECQCLPVSASDLAMSVPDDTWLWIDPENDINAELSPEEIRQLVAVASGGEVREAVDEDSSVVTQEETEELPPALEHRTRDEGAMTSALSALVRSFPEISEAYFLEAEHEHAEGVLGLLTQGMSSERRFELMTDLAELSRNMYGEAGALEVYDDLHEPQSGSWELFQALVPFYSLSDERAESLERVDEDVHDQPGVRERRPTFSRFRQKPSRMAKLQSADDD